MVNLRMGWFLVCGVSVVMSLGGSLVASEWGSNGVDLK